MRTMMLSGCLLAAMVACGPSVLRGVDTSNRMPWAIDCGVSVEVPSHIPTLHGPRVGDGNSILLAPDEVPADMIGVLDETQCLGAAAGGTKALFAKPSIRVVKLTEETVERSPTAATDPKKRYRMSDLKPSEWPAK